MAKCGKGCMPECEYFTTGGCISPLSCPYKIETGYINSATSTTDSLTGLLMEFDEMGLLRQRRAPDEICPAWDNECIRLKVASYCGEVGIADRKIHCFKRWYKYVCDEALKKRPNNFTAKLKRGRKDNESDF